MVETLTSFKIELQIFTLKLLLLFALCMLVAKGFILITVERIVGLIREW